MEHYLAEIDWAGLGRDRDYYPSPTHWEDEVLYFLLVDRFSDRSEYGGFADRAGNEVSGPGQGRTTPLFSLARDANRADFSSWFAAGRSWCGGTLAGIRDKLGYLRRMGVSAIWLSPVFRQVSGSDDYHGYGIQNFLEVDPHFGSRQELRDLVREAHDTGLRVILDIILNHGGDVFAYQGNQPWFYYQGK
ncbi:MAG TPA: alpha-amylase, partial [Desulfobulbus sp.]|nr:alpha-amylase [Desulfobulbus sp.]